MTLPRVLRTPSCKAPSKKSSQISLFDPCSETQLITKDIDIPSEFDIIKTLHEGTLSKILLVRRHNASKDRLAIKAIAQQNLEDFYKELNYTYYLSPHPNVVKCYNISIIWDDFYVFPMEYAPFGNLQRFAISSDQNDSSECMGEKDVKLVAKQLASALEFIHGLKLVHRDICPENVLVFKQDFSQIKLCDFGSTRPEKSLVVCNKDIICGVPSSSLGTLSSEVIMSDVYRLPPEVCQLVKGESYYCHSSSDVWQVGILIYYCLTGGAEPWQSADEIVDPTFSEFVDWTRRKVLRIPESFLGFTPRLLRLLKRMFEPKQKKRCEITEVYKYLEDEWIGKLYRGSSFRRGVLERKASSSTSRSRSTDGTRNSNRAGSTRRKSVRINLRNNNDLNICSGGNNKIVSRESLIMGEGKHHDRPREVDKDFVKERIGQWIIESSVATSLSP